MGPPTGGGPMSSLQLHSQDSVCQNWSWYFVTASQAFVFESIARHKAPRTFHKKEHEYDNVLMKWTVASAVDIFSKNKRFLEKSFLSF